MSQFCEDCEEESASTVGSTATNAHDETDDIPGFYIPDPESRTGLRIWWVKRAKPGGPPRRQLGFYRA